MTKNDENTIESKNTFTHPMKNPINIKINIIIMTLLNLLGQFFCKSFHATREARSL